MSEVDESGLWLVMVSNLLGANPLTIVPCGLYITPEWTMGLDLDFQTHDIDERRSSLMPVLMTGESSKLPSGVVPDPPRRGGVAGHVASC